MYAIVSLTALFSSVLNSVVSNRIKVYNVSFYQSCLIIHINVVVHV